jgi:hypothetical protein
MLSETTFAQGVNKLTFALEVNPAFLNCLAANPADPPMASVTVVRGKPNDLLKISVAGLKPNLAFDLFTVQRSNLGPDAKPVANFPGFGLGWYQSDLQANAQGVASATIQTILIDQIFGFDPDVKLPPTNTCHVGFGFNDPKDAASCGFDARKPLPFNGEHNSGPTAMISLPDPKTDLGPLCLTPNPDNTCHL